MQDYRARWTTGNHNFARVYLGEEQMGHPAQAAPEETKEWNEIILTKDKYDRNQILIGFNDLSLDYLILIFVNLLLSILVYLHDSIIFSFIHFYLD